MKTPTSNSESGFTLIELLTIIGIMSVLVYLSLSSLAIVKANAGHKSAMRSVQDARTAVEAATAEPDATYPLVNFTQTVQGPISDSDGALLLPALQVSRQTSFTFYHDPDCLDATCTADRVQVKHCLGRKYVLWTRYGDGAEVLLDDLPGAGC